MKSIAHFIVGKWWFCVLFAVVMSGLSLQGMISSGGGSDLREEKSAYILKSELDEEFGSDGGECLILVDVVDGEGDLFTPQRLALLREIVNEVEALPFVQNLVSLDDVKTGLTSSPK